MYANKLKPKTLASSTYLIIACVSKKVAKILSVKIMIPAPFYTIQHKKVSKVQMNQPPAVVQIVTYITLPSMFSLCYFI